MARAGDVLTNPVTGQTLRFLQTAADTGGALLEMESTWAPGGVEPPEHLHPRQAERFTVLEGTVRVRMDGTLRDLKPGDTLEVPANVPHGMWNPGDGPAAVRWEVRPALATERMFEALFGLAARGDVNARGVPGLLDMSVLLRRHRGEFRLTRPAPVVQGVVFGALAPVGRLLGKGRA
jgi:quercetin dioxygenase-like cupin family protein